MRRVRTMTETTFSQANPAFAHSEDAAVEEYVDTEPEALDEGEAPSAVEPEPIVEEPEPEPEPEEPDYLVEADDEVVAEAGEDVEED
jgi:hypothetical protein